MNTKPILIVSGEPYSVLFEILFKSLGKYKPKNPLILVGSKRLMQDQITELKLSKKISINFIKQNYKISDLKKNSINIIDVNFKYTRCFDKISKKSKKYIENCFEIALKLCKLNKISGFINGPISKPHFLNNKFLGITEYLADKTLSKNYVMLIYNKKISVAPITTHLPLSKVSRSIKKKDIISKVRLIKEFYKKQFKIDPSIGITGLNPHNENIYQISEEEKIIKPAIRFLKKRYNNVDGPFPADSLFMKKNLKKFDVIVGMYHDQVLTPIKALYNFEPINITLGLPFLRISPDHGTNNQMIGKNKSNPLSLIKAIKFLDQN